MIKLGHYQAEEFLEAVLRGASARKVQVPKGTILWRAQLGSEWVEDPHHPTLLGLPPERMKPRQAKATEGRANPKGLPVLYLGYTKETAMAEIRPSKGVDISLAQFKVLHNLTVVDFSTENHRHAIYLGEPDEAERDAVVWADIDRAFSEPTQRSDDGSEYIATQVIADAIRAAGYDGIAYQSGLEKGHNLAIFDIDAADLINCAVWSLDRVTYEFSQAGNPYYVNKHYPRLDRSHDEAEGNNGV